MSTQYLLPYHLYLPGLLTPDTQSGSYPGYTFPDSVIPKVQNPRWRSQIAHHANATTTRSGDRYEWRGKEPRDYELHISYRKKNVKDAPILSGYLYGSPWGPSVPSIVGFTGSDFQKARDQAASYFYKSMRRALASASGANIVAEFRETLQTLRHPYETFIREASNIVTRKVKRKSKKTGALYDTILETNFGWKPLVSDALDIQRALSLIGTRIESTPVNGVGYNRISQGSRSSIQHSFANNLLWFNSENWVDAEWMVNYYGATRLQLHSLATDLRILGLSNQDIIPAIWEAIPWTWLIDYFSNVGDWLEAATMASSDVAWAGVSMTSSGVSNMTLNFDKGTSNTYFGYSGYEIVGFAESGTRFALSRKSFSRQPVDGVPVQSIHLEFPGFGSHKTQWLNMLSVLGQRLNKP